MQTIVQFSGGKDSTAALLYTLEHLTSKPLVVFCDTGFESPETYAYIEYVGETLGIEIKTIRSTKYSGMFDMVEKKKRFPSTRARFCTEELKVKPMVDFILDTVQDDFVAIQGIRGDESAARAKMAAQCTYFKFYLQPYGRDKEGKPKYHAYRAKEVKAYVQKYVADVLRPIFDWSGKQTIDYIISKGLEVNPLYKKGFKRVGCFPCVMSGLSEIEALQRFYPERVAEIAEFEQRTGHSLFTVGKIPKNACKNNKFPTIVEVARYVQKAPPMFENSSSCMSYYNICE